MNVPLLLLLVLGIPLILYLVHRRHQTLRCDELLRRMHPYQLRGRDKILEDPKTIGVWAGTDGIRGLYYRWQNRRVFLGLCQIRVQRHNLDSKELRAITRRAARLTALTGLLILLAPFHRLRLVDRLSRYTFVIYAEIADRTHTLFANDDEPVCSLRLATLL